MTSSFAIVAGPAKAFTLTLPTKVTVASEVTASAVAKDTFGNLALTYAGSPVVTSTDTQATLPASVVFAAGTVASFKVKFATTGIQTLTLTEGAVSGVATTTVTPFEQPTAVITKPTEGQVVSGKATSVTATATVPSGTTVKSLTILIDGAVATATEASFDWDTTAVKNGAHTVVAVVVDSSGNSAMSPQVNVTVTNTAGCGCSSGGEASLLFGLIALVRFAARRRRSANKGDRLTGCFNEKQTSLSPFGYAE